jgi:hypothetical protein
MQVVRRVHAMHLPHRGAQARETTAVWSETCVARWGSEDDDMRRTAPRCVRVLQKRAGPRGTPFLLIGHEVRSASKTCTQFSPSRAPVAHVYGPS